MPTLLLSFPGGRYHATPPGHHVNEGLVEWPPSPWRLLRALIACGYATHHWSEVPATARRLIEALASTLPTYRLPQASVAHSRHFMPLGTLKNGRESTTLVYDTWAEVGQQPLAVRWPCALAREAHTLFGSLATQLGYLGRSESWVVASAIGDDATLPPGQDAYPHSGDASVSPHWEQVSLLVPELPETYADWRKSSVANALDAHPLPDAKKRPSKKLLKERTAAVASYPSDLLDCLQRDTAWWKGHGWGQPPGSRRVLYLRRSDALTVGPPAAYTRRPSGHVAAMLLALTTPRGTRSALPTRARTLPQGELLHRALVSVAARGESVLCPALTGRDEGGKLLRGHRHASILPTDLDRDGHLDHILVHAPMGLDPRAQQAIRSLRRTWTRGGVGDLQLAVAGQGSLADLLGLSSPLDVGIRQLLGPTGSASAWVSETPFVPPRHPKPRGSSSIEGQVLAELASRDLPSAEVRVLPWNEQNHALRHAVRVRRHPAHPPPVDAGFAISLIFSVPVPGPISLGYAAHFGLGQFRALEV
ncbi:MAG: type I-U CRISPR-associated protein Cas5/Cas6 [Proteobacteria bacterium]|nr:type I-U CRISPR-associated protein Cas5/Cas6 [Pseudomonadota bacterium]